MDAVEARTFGRESEVHIAILAEEAASRGCSCQAYVDWFTYRRCQVKPKEGGE